MKLLVIALLVTGCRSATSQYYTLLSPPREHPAAVTEAFQLDVLPIDVPPEVDREEMVVREGPGKLTPVQTRSWVAPLARELRHAFSDDLSHTLGARDVAGATPVAGIPTYRIKVVVQRFDSSLDTGASIEAISTIRDATGAGAALVCSHRAREAGGGQSYEHLVEAHQRAVAAIAAQIASTVRALQAGTAACSPDPRGA